MGIIASRGSKNMLDAIRKGARAVSESNGIAALGSVPKAPVAPTVQVSDGQVQSALTQAFGASVISPRPVVAPVTERTATAPAVDTRMVYERLYESVSTVNETKEFFNATSSLFTLYATGKLDESVVRSLSVDSLMEVKAIVREFKSVLDQY